MKIYKIIYFMLELFQTRIFVTNSLSFLPQVDKIIMLENGQIIESGNYDALKNSDGFFSKFIENYLAVQKPEDTRKIILDVLTEK